jgi:hypothetical protein
MCFASLYVPMLNLCATHNSYHKMSFFCSKVWKALHTSDKSFIILQILKKYLRGGWVVGGGWWVVSGEW